MAEELCPCSNLEWLPEQMTLEHHPDCNSNSQAKNSFRICVIGSEDIPANVYGVYVSGQIACACGIIFNFVNNGIRELFTARCPGCHDHHDLKSIAYDVSSKSQLHRMTVGYKRPW